MKTLFLVRHGEVPEEYRGRYIGVTDPGLSPEGSAACMPLSKLDPEITFHSPLKRAGMTASLIPGEKIVDPELREIDFGRWENLTFEQIDTPENRSSIQCWIHTPEKLVFPEGEAVAAFYARADNFLKRMETDPHRKIAAVTHGGIIMRIRCRVRGLPMSRQLEFLPKRGTFVTLFFENGVWYEK